MGNLASKWIVVATLLGTVVACSGSDEGTSSSGGSSSGGSSGGGGTSSSSSSSSSSSGSGKPSGATSKTCDSSDDCGNWFCDCKDSSGDTSPVNARNCTNGYCLDAASTCPKACSAFGKTWTGSAGGGPEN